MASSEKSEKLGLSLWEASDRPERLDFRQDNEQLEQLLGGHLVNDSLHLTPEQKNYLQAPYALYVYGGTGDSLAGRIAPFRPKVVIAMCMDAPPVVQRSDGKFEVYWDYWADATLYGQEKICGMGGVSMGAGTNFRTYSKESETNSDIIFKMNEKDKYYLAIFIPSLS